MSLAKTIPLMEPGKTGRNAAVAVVYFITSPFWLSLLPFILFGFVWKDYGGIATSLSGIPGISAGGGVASGVVACVLCLVLFGLIGAAIPGGDGSEQPDPSAAGDVDGATDTPDEANDETATPSSDKERAENALLEGYRASNSDYRDGVREVDTIDQVDEEDGYLIELRYNLFVDGFGSLEDDAERRAGQVAVSTLQAVAEGNAEDVTTIAIYAYVPTEDGGDAVSTKIVIEMSTVESINWGSYNWQSLREDADQYMFNDHLYE